ncbi:MAG: FGGY family carbohydrate kinase, partial [Pacificimonas sp.]
MNETDQSSSRDLLVLDVGKTHTKLIRLSEGGHMRQHHQIKSPRLTDGLYPALDVDCIYDWFLNAASELPDPDAISDIFTMTHGAAFAVVKNDELAFPVMDYEFSPPAEFCERYEALRPPFSETKSPRLPQMLNTGQQLFYQQELAPDRFAAADMILPLAQYFAFRFGGRAASERGALGCHTDLWEPEAGRFSDLAVRNGWSAKFPPMANAKERVGIVSSIVAAKSGLRRDTAIYSGGHDSNIELAPFLRLSRTAILATGTWFVAMAPGTSTASVDEERDMLCGVAVDGRAVPTARAMIGREFEVLGGDWGDIDIARVLASR